MIVAFNHFDSLGVASSQLSVSSQTSVASLVVASHLYLNISGIASFKLIVVSHSVDKVPFFPFSNCTALCEGDIARFSQFSSSKLFVDSITFGDKVSYTHFKDCTALCEGFIR